MRLFICALWSPAGKGRTSWFSFVVSNCEFVTFPIGILGQVWYLIVSIPDLCTLTYFSNFLSKLMRAVNCLQFCLNPFCREFEGCLLKDKNDLDKTLESTCIVTTRFEIML